MFKNFYKHIAFRFEKFNNNCLYLKNNKNYYLLLHNRLATSFSPNQLSDILTYEIFLNKYKDATESAPVQDPSKFQNYNTDSNYVLVYNLHNLLHNNRLFIFTKLSGTSSRNFSVNTVSELYINANWLERELAEMYGLQFVFKKDLRNLMLQYGDTSTPFKKSFPVIGFRETSYNVLSDLVVQNRFDLQN